MAHVNLVCIPLLPVVGDVVEVLGVLDEATSGVVARGSWIKLHSWGERDIYWWGVLISRIVRKEVELRGGSGVVGSFFFHLPPVVVVVLASGGEGGAVRVRTGICIGIPSVWGGRDG
jgi:hypothetical protein